MDWLPVVDPIAHGMLIMGTAGIPKRRKGEGNDSDAGTEFEVRAPGGWGGKLSGVNAVFIIIFLAQFAFIAIMVFRLKEHEDKGSDLVERSFKTMTDILTNRDLRLYNEIQQRQNELLSNQVKILAGQQDTQRELRIQTYIMTLSEKQKAELRLDMPAELRSRQRYTGPP